MPAMEDAEEFKHFEAAIRADYQPASMIEHELVARLTSLLWRLRRSTLIETNLFQLQARLAREQKLMGRSGPDNNNPGMEILYRLFRSPETVVPLHADSVAPELDNHGPEVANARENAT